jgi:hypothetical protein
MSVIRAVVRGGRLVFESVRSGIVRRPKGSVEVPLNPGPSARSSEPETGPIRSAGVGTGAGEAAPDRELSQHWGWPQ